MAKNKSATIVEDDEDIVLDEDVELEDMDTDVEEDEAPAKSKKSSQPAVTFGASTLASHLSEETGETISAKDLRVLIRKMARDGRVDREVKAGNRQRYDWPKGLKDPEVKAIVKAVKAGELAQGKKEALEALKSRKADKKAAEENGSKKKGKKNKKVAVVEDDEDDDE